MIKEDTVFIIGAGANVPYGFPTGAKLRKLIVNNFSQHTKKQVQKSNGSSQHHLFNKIDTLANSFCSEFDSSGTQSIDLFLSRRPVEYGQIGKFAIAYYIYRAEAESLFNVKMQDKYSEQDWMGFLFNWMSDELRTKDDYRRFSSNKITFISFNYDRSLENYLYTCFTNNWPNADYNSIPIRHLIPFKVYHVYGSLGALPWEEKTDRFKIDYPRTSSNSLDDYNTLENMSNNINLIGDRRDAVVESAINKISEAKNIFFLGFGFANENLQALNIPSSLRINQQKIAASAYGSRENERKKILLKLYPNASTSFLDKFKHNNDDYTNENIHIANCDCLTLLRDHL